MDELTPTDGPADNSTHANARWRAFLEWVETNADVPRLYRGVADADTHRLQTSLGRRFPGHSKPGMRQMGEHLLRQFRARVREFVDVAACNDWDILALAQHHGVPTQMLDWSYNPLVAAFFAVTSRPADAKAAARIFVVDKPHEIETDRHHFREVDEVGLVAPQTVTRRIMTQKGIFTFHPHPAEIWSPKGIAPSHFDIPREMCEYFEQRLATYGIDTAHIMADLAGVSETIRKEAAWRHQGVA